jgi:hypothetical protein
VSRFAGIAALVVVLALVLLFTRWNGAERMTLELGFHTFYRVPTVWVVFVSFLLGMTVMLLTGLHADLKVRRYLRDRLNREEEDPGPAPPVDRLQQDLFSASPASVPPALPASAPRGIAVGPPPAVGGEGELTSPGAPAHGAEVGPDGGSVRSPAHEEEAAHPQALPDAATDPEPRGETASPVATPPRPASPASPGRVSVSPSPPPPRASAPPDPPAAEGAPPTPEPRAP